jgi:hypothetical protein
MRALVTPIRSIVVSEVAKPNTATARTSAPEVISIRALARRPRLRKAVVVDGESLHDRRQLEHLKSLADGSPLGPQSDAEGLVQLLEEGVCHSHDASRGHPSSMTPRSTSRRRPSAHALVTKSTATSERSVEVRSLTSCRR